MSRRLLEHVSEVELELDAPDEAGLFAEAAAAFRELAGGGGRRGPPLRRDVALDEAEPALLLVDWLNELVFLAEVEAFVPARVDRIDLRHGLRATLAGARGRPRHLVKAATVNELEVSPTPGGWHAHVVLDI